MLMPPNDPARLKPLDHPTPARPHRVYVALTNHCNRACPWCSTCSSPAGSTFITPEDYAASLPHEGLFQLQLEGGEPTVHPQFWEFVRLARDNPRCTHLVLCTNGVMLPRVGERLAGYIARLGAPLTIKMSINHHLIEHDPGLIQLSRDLRDVMAAMGGERLLVLNVRLRRGHDNDDAAVRRAVEQAGLLPHANVFYLQRYGFASGEENWEPPRPVWDNFTLVNPDGRRYGPDLIARSEGMRVLP
jgi:MoaA/NifB/PqqE/SkfB family radical SAM enzyme